MVLNDCEHVWRIVNDGIETVFIVCIRAIDILNETNSSINNFTNISILNETNSPINNFTNISILNKSIINSSFFSVPSPGMYPNISNPNRQIIIDSPSSELPIYSPSPILSKIISPSSSIAEPSSSSIAEPSSSSIAEPSSSSSIFYPSPSSSIAEPSSSSSIAEPSSSVFYPSPSNLFYPSPSNINGPSSSNIIDFASPSSIFNINRPNKSDISSIIEPDSFNTTANFSLDNYTIPVNIVNKHDIGLILGILIPLWFIFTSITMYLYCKKRGSKAIMPCNTPEQKTKKKDIFTRPKDYLLEIIPNNDIPEVEKPPPPIPPRPKLMMLTDSFDEDDNVEVINVAYGIKNNTNKEN